MARRILVGAALAAFVVCALALAQGRKAAGDAKIGVVDVMRITGGKVIPWHINYQGYLTDDAGNPITNPALVCTLSIWTDVSGGSQLWWEPWTLNVQGGLFNVVLGTSTPIPASVFALGQPRWLQLAVGSQTLSPRTEVTSVGYAYRAVKTDSTDYALNCDRVDNFHASAAPGLNDLFPLSYGDSRWVNEGQADAVTSPMILNGTIARADVATSFKAPYADTADYALNSAPDNDWTITGSVLHPSADYGLAMRGSNVLHGANAPTHVCFGIACTTGTSGQNYQYCTVGGGYLNAASRLSATVGGGWDNTATGGAATVGGGVRNTASDLATVGGGQDNSATGGAATVGGGRNNTASGTYATVGGGQSNSASGTYATVGGGYADTVAGDYSFAAGDRVRLTGAADYTLAFGSNFTTPTPNAVVFYHSGAETKVGIRVLNPTNILTIQQTSATDPIADAWTVYSSRRWKTNIHPIQDALQKVKQLRGVHFDWNGNGQHDIGMIAEEVGEVIPEVVAYEGNGKDAKSLDYARLVALLVEAVKEQQQEIESLREELESLNRR